MPTATPPRCPPPTLLARIARLPTMSWRDLLTEYQRLFNADPPVRHRRFVERRIACRWQEVAYRNTDRNRLDRNRRRIAALVKTGALPARVRKTTPAPGTVLTRHYRGAEHRVLVLPNGQFAYDGQHYASLSAIARAITGTRWSGPAFFGLRKAAQPEHAR